MECFHTQAWNTLKDQKNHDTDLCLVFSLGDFVKVEGKFLSLNRLKRSSLQSRDTYRDDGRPNAGQNVLFTSSTYPLFRAAHLDCAARSSPGCLL